MLSKEEEKAIKAHVEAMRQQIERLASYLKSQHNKAQNRSWHEGYRAACTDIIELVALEPDPRVAKIKPYDPNDDI